MAENNIRRQVAAVVIELNARRAFLSSTVAKARVRTSRGFAPHVLSIQFEQVERIQKHLPTLTPISEAVEHRQPVAITGQRLIVDQE